MKCNKFSILEGCNNCSCVLNDTNSIPLLSTSCVIDILDVIMKECSTNTNDILLLDKSTLDCNGNITIVYSTDKVKTYIEHNRYICYKFIHVWLKCNTVQIHTAMEIIYLILCASILSCNEREQKALELITNLEILFNYIQRYITLLNKSSSF